MKDGKLNLHKLNGVRIAVPVAKMSLEDLEYVERMTGISLDEDKPLSDLKKRAAAKNGGSRSGGSGVKVGASVEPKKPEYDWFQFFLSCDVQPGLCERYAQAFARDSMDESVLPDVDATVLRNLGFREGDIIKVTRYLDAKYCRGRKGDEEATGGLFSGPGGALRNNTRKGRPAPPVETNNTVDPNAFNVGKPQPKEPAPAETKPASPPAAAPASPAKPPSGGFDDNAWEVKPSKTPEPAPQPAPAPAPAAAPAPTAVPVPTPAPAPAPVPSTAKLTGSMQELSLLTQPLVPEKAQPPPPPPSLNLAPAPAPAPAPALAQIPQPTGATPGFFTGMQPPTVNGLVPQQTQQQFPQQQQQQLPQTIARQRPMAPQYTQGQGGLMPPPPPSRPLSAPQQMSAQPSAFTPPPLQPQMTGYVPQVAPPGQSLNDIAQARMQQQQQQQFMQAQQQMPMMTGMPQQQMPMMTGMPQQQPQQQGPFMQPQPTGMGMGMPGMGAGMGMAPPIQIQPTGFMQQQQQPQQQQPQQTGMGMPGMGGMGMGMQPMQPIQMQPTGLAPPGGSGGMLQPLVPQKTGPPPPVRFGVNSEAKKLAPQPTGRRANLAAASEYSLFTLCYSEYMVRDETGLTCVCSAG